jgi:hypothetical protein
MKIAIGIIAMLLGLTVLLQSCTVSLGGGLLEDEAVSQAGAVGVFVGFLYFVGGAFAFGLPVVSMVVFVVAAVFGLAAGASGDFSDLTIWGGAAVILSAMSFLAWRSQRKAKHATTANEGVKS